MIFFILAAGALAQEDEIYECKPVLFPPEETIKAGAILFGPINSLLGAEDGKRAYFRLWLDNVSNRTNVTNLTNVTEVA